MGKSTVSAEVRGVKETMEALRDVERKVGKKILRQASRKAMTPILREAKRRAPRRTGALKKALGIKQKVYRGGTVVTRIGVRKGNDLTLQVVGRDGTPRTIVVKPSRYAHLVEFGDADTRAQPYLRPAWDAARGALPDRLAEEIRDGLKRTKARGMVKRG